MSKLFAAPFFLKRLKPLLEAGNLSFEPRNKQKTREFMLKEGLSEDDAFEIIYRLGPEHYFCGPEPDDDGSPGDVMVFFCPYQRLAPPKERIRLYIKLKIWTDSSGAAGIVMSFHDEGNI